MTVTSGNRLSTIDSVVATALQGHVTYTVTVVGDVATVEISDGNYGHWAVQALLQAGFVADYRGRDGSRIEARWDDSLHNLARRADADITAERLQLAWCMSKWGSDELYAETWRHVLDCDEIVGSMTIGEAHGGACDTCFHTYPAVLWDLRCGCGLLRFTDQDIAGPYDGWELPVILAEMGDLRARYRSTEATYPVWMPGISRRPKR